mgnify:CR=1 FL=1
MFSHDAHASPSRWLAVAVLTTMLASLLGSGAGAAPGATTRSAPGLKPAVTDVTTIRQFDTTQPVIALTFDAGSDRGYGVQILDTLKAKGVHATFGMTGLWAQSNSDLVRRMTAEGHQLINHTWDHQSFTGTSSGTAPLTAAQIVSELDRADNLVYTQSGIHMTPYFRPPYGDINDASLAAAGADGYRYNIMWTVDTLGWNGASVSEITSRTLAAAAPGAIVLMHVGAASQDAAALPSMIDALRARGYSFATVAEFVSGNLAASQRYFPETDHWISHGFLRYWQQFGGLPVFGYPISDEFQENGVTVQYFERARFEWHPGAWPSRYDVLLGLLGNELTVNRRAEAPFKPVQATSDANCTFYPATGHRLCFGFRAFWQANGGLAIYGYPISEEFQENGYTVQYFERQRLEYHPENPPAWQVEGGLLGSQVLATHR